MKNWSNDKGVIIVGNGTSILDVENGREIDSFNNVVRFNSFKTTEYEKYTGSKTDIWFTVNLTHKERINHFQRVIFHSWINHNDCKVFKEIRDFRNVIKLSKRFIKQIPISDPSTGLLAIYYFLNEVDSLHITGFDWWDREEHHYGDNELRGTLHSPDKEKEIIYKLIDEGFVKIV